MFINQIYINIYIIRYNTFKITFNKGVRKISYNRYNLILLKSLFHLLLQLINT
jgi:hypothetical protein